VTMKNAVFWDVTRCGCCKNRRFRGTLRLHHQGYQKRRTKTDVLTCVRLLLVTANVIASSPIIFTLIMETIRSSETSTLLRPIRRNIPEYGIFLFFYFFLTLLFLFRLKYSFVFSYSFQLSSFYCHLASVLPV
jgi:hypothetical protein